MSGTGVVKAGYLIKCAKTTGKNWKKRYCVLTGNTLNYYVAHNNLATPKGNVLLVGDASVSLEDIRGTGGPQAYGFRLSTPFESILFVAMTNEDRASWMRAIEAAIELSNRSLRGYMLLLPNSLLSSTVRKFFVLHHDILTYHLDHEHTSIDQFSLKVTPQTDIKHDDVKHKIKLADSTGTKICKFQFEKRSEHEYPVWRDAIYAIRDRHIQVAKKAEQHVTQAIEESILRGKLMVRGANGQWGENMVAMTETEVVIRPMDPAQGPGEVYYITKDMAVRVVEGSRAPFTFEITTPKGVVQISCTSQQEMDHWIQTLQSFIPQPLIIDTSDVLYRAALSKIAEDVFYEVQYLEQKPLGLVMQKVDEWAIAMDFKGYDAKVTGVLPGSALTSVNDELIMFDDYFSTISRLKDWKPPLKLTFRKAPEKHGYLNKRSAAARGGPPSWKRRFFVLGEGKMSIFANETMVADTRVDLPLQHATVSLVHSSEYDKFFCFRLQVDMINMVLQAGSLEEMLDWAATLYHAIAMANGGKHILDFERKRQQDEAERQAAFMAAQWGPEYAHIAAAINDAMASENVAELQAAMEMAMQVGLGGDFLTFAQNCLSRFIEEQNLRDNDARLFQETSAPNEDQLRLQEEAASMDARFGLASDGNDEDDDAGMIVSPGAIAMRMSAGHRLSVRSGGGAGEGALDSSPELDQEEQLLVEKAKLVDPDAHLEAASELDLAKVFSFYIKVSDTGEKFINVMNFCTIWRMVTGERGNLMQEMQMFNRFDTQKNGFLTESDFVYGWIQHANDTGSQKLLKKLKFFVGDDNVML